MNPAIYIDDSGTSDKSKSKYDPGNWKSWLGIVIDPEKNIVIENTLKSLKQYYKVNEFHFNEIFAGTKEYKKISLEQRIEIFWKFADIYRQTEIPIFIQSLTNDDVIRNQMEHFRYFNFDKFDFQDNSQLALWFLLKRISENPIIISSSKPIDFYIDAGIQKPETKREIAILKNLATEDSINFIDSKNSLLMQLVDFAAFCLNRNRWILMNNKKGDSDWEIMQIIEYANFNTMNMAKRYINVQETNTIEFYDKLLRDKYDENGNLSDEEMEKRKRNK